MNTKHTDSFDESYHYWRECHKCGHAGNHYLHCLHDKIQSDCIKCGDKLPSIPQDCNCDFTTTETELHHQLQKARQDEYGKGFDDGMKASQGLHS